MLYILVVLSLVISGISLYKMQETKSYFKGIKDLPKMIDKKHRQIIGPKPIDCDIKEVPVKQFNNLIDFTSKLAQTCNEINDTCYNLNLAYLRLDTTLNKEIKKNIELQVSVEELNKSNKLLIEKNNAVLTSNKVLLSRVDTLTEKVDSLTKENVELRNNNNELNRKVARIQQDYNRVSGILNNSNENGTIEKSFVLSLVK